MMQTRIHQSGLTLVELMVGMFIALVALGAGGALYLSSSQTNRVLQMQNHLTEDGRFALQMIQRLVSQAGYRDNPGEARGLGNPHFAVTSATAFTVGFKADGTNIMACDGTVNTSGNKSFLVEKNGSCLQCRSTGGSAGACPSTNNNVIDLIGPLASGLSQGTEVADFRVLYGIDTGPNPTEAAIACGGGSRDCIADSYATTLSGATVDQVVAVQVCLVLRTENTNPTLASKAAVRNCANSADIANSATDEKLYRTFRSTILLRNF